MDKRALSAVPRPLLTDKNKEMPRLVPRMSYLVTADRLEINGTDTLIINFFHAEEAGLKPAFRTFCQMDDYISQDLTTDKIKWKTGAVNYLTGYLYWYRNGGNIVMASVEERKTILGFLYDFKKKNGVNDYQRIMAQGRSVADTEVGDRIDEYQDTIKGWKLQGRHKKEKEEIDLQMEKFGGLPPDYGQFVKDMVFSSDNYIFYNRSEKWAYCTKCGHDFEIRKNGLYHRKIAVWNDTDQIRHNSTARCPFCSSYLVCKSEGMGRKKLFVVKWSVLVQKCGEEVLVRYFCHTKNFCADIRKPLIESCEKFRTVHTAEKAFDFEWRRFKGTAEIRWCVFKDRSYGCWLPPETEVPRNAVLYNRNLLEDVSGTCMKYSAVDIFINNVAADTRDYCGAHYMEPDGRTLGNPWCLEMYFNSYRKKPYLEQLLKTGFYKIAKEVLSGRRRPEFKNGRTIMDTLGINKQQFNMLRQAGNPSVRDVMILRYAGEIRQKDFELLRHTHDEGYNKVYKDYLDMRQYTTIYKLRKYMQKQKIVHDRDYFDYAGWLEEMGYDLRSEFNLYPQDFKKAHDEKSKEYIKFQDKKAQEDIKRYNKLLKKFREKASDAGPLNLKIDGLFIRLPENLDELIKEGERLRHCVGTYRDKVAEGKTTIFFIRKEEEPQKPYFTLEWSGSVVQCRGRRNCGMTPKVKAFVKVFQEKMEEYEDTCRSRERRDEMADKKYSDRK